MENKVLIGLLTQEYARRSDFYDYLTLMHKPLNSMVIFSHGRSPAKGRNVIIEAALDLNCTHILFMDDDMAPRPNDLYKLLHHDVDIVSGLYLSRGYPHTPWAFDIADESGAALPMYLMSEKPVLRPIVAAGLGFLLVKTDVFRKMEKPWIRLGELNSEEWCDDIGFFKRVREAGFQSYVDTSVRIGHIGTMIIWPSFENGEWAAGYDSNGTTQINIPLISKAPDESDIAPRGGRIFQEK